MKYLVPVENFNKLEKMVNFVNNKAKKEVAKLSIINTTYKKINFIESIKYYEVEFECNYNIDGYELVAQLKVLNGGNLINCFNSRFIDNIPSKYRNTKCECEHCKTIRNRDYLYLIYNSQEKEFKQVGSSCIKDYTNCYDESIINKFTMIQEELNIEPTENFVGNKYYDIEDIKKLAYIFVKKYGYKKAVSGNAFKEKIDNKELIKDLEVFNDYEKIDTLNNYVNSINTNNANEYIYNSCLVWNQNYITEKEFTLLLSFVNYILNQLQKQNTISSSIHKYNIGDKIEIEVNTIKLLYTKSFRYSFNNYSTSYVFLITDKEDNFYKFSTTLMDGDTKVNKIKGTVKELTTYNGVKQTILKNIKIF